MNGRIVLLASFLVASACSVLGNDNEPAQRDADGDGYEEGVDCDDGDPLAWTEDEAEVCDLGDNDCDGATDEGFETQGYFPDADGDGYVTGFDESVTITACMEPEGYSPWVSPIPQGLITDCDDSEASVYPGAAEACNHRDDDCDGATDEGAPTLLYCADYNGDGQVCSPCLAVCSQAELPSDCSDSSSWECQGLLSQCFTWVPIDGQPDENCCDADTDCDGSSDSIENQCKVSEG
ncbi:MAG TPA: putative metal-binding motif-containing protein [bacterium]|nr:putative metal-binding motif-containing protein [bacterium]